MTNGLLVVPDGNSSERSKINLKQLYEIFKDTKSHGLVSLQFLCALDIFFGGNLALTELYYNLWYEALGRNIGLRFEHISDLITDVSFQMKKSTLSNTERKN